MSYWGELYLRSTTPFLAQAVTSAEVDYLAATFEGVTAPVADLGCGHGRHAARLAERGKRIVGLELDALSLARAGRGFPAVRGDFTRLPFRDGSLGGAFAWYSTLFIHDDRQHLATLREVRRALRPGALLVLHTVPYERLAKTPEVRFEHRLSDGGTLREQSRFDPATGYDVGTRQLMLADGRVLSGTYTIRYYPLPELLKLLWAAGLSLRWAHGTLEGGPPSPESTDLIVAAEPTNA